MYFMVDFGFWSESKLEGLSAVSLERNWSDDSHEAASANN